MRVSDLINRLAVIQEREGDLAVVMDCAAEGPNCGSFTMTVPSPTVISVSERSVQFTNHAPGETVWDLVGEVGEGGEEMLFRPKLRDILRVVTVGV